MKKLIAFFRNLFDFYRHTDDFIAADMSQHDRIIHPRPLHQPPQPKLRFHLVAAAN